MTSVCVAGGPSQIKPAFGATVFVSASALETFLVAKVGAWGALVAAAVAGTNYGLTAMCTIDPPADPGVNAGDIIAILGGPLNNGYLDAVNKVRQLLQRYLWYQFCECVSGTQPTAPGPLSPPSGTPAVDPPAVFVPPVTAPCYSFTSGAITISSSGSHIDVQKQLDGLVPTAMRVSWVKTIVSGGGCTSTLQFSQQKIHPTPSSVQNDAVSAGPAQTFSQTIPVLAGVELIQLIDNYVSGAGVSQVVWALELFCGGQGPGLPLSPCCPPDAATSALLAQILGLVTLVQRQAAPFGYVPGATHSGLADNGSLTIADLIGIKVDVTTLPAAYGRASGDPIQYFELGRLTWGTSDGYRSSTLLEHDGQVIFPPLAGVYTRLGYSLAPGVAVTITELAREP